MLTISREADYAARVVVRMAGAPEERVQAKTLAKEEHVPDSFLIKILQTLIQHHVVRSFRGAGGGYQLTADPAKLNLYRLLEMMEGTVGLNVCVVSGAGCDLERQCSVHDVWVEAQAQLRKTLESMSVAELAQRTKEKRACYAAECAGAASHGNLRAGGNC